mmetsp:Transcript_7325/g.18329  ORF Transcript_7325/g.18329 Transcript_7325/m.18329 type:complete len:336 (-) Transcript_7325:227-1234(-)
MSASIGSMPCRDRARKCITYVPLASLFFFSHPTVSLDQVEKALQMFGMITVLLASCVVSTFEVDIEGLEREAQIASNLFVAVQVYMLLLFLILVCYIYLMLVFVQEGDEQIPGAVDDSDLKTAVLLRQWWNSWGRILFFLMLVLLVVASDFYFKGIRYYFHDKYDMPHVAEVRYILVFGLPAGIALIHVSFLQAIQKQSKNSKVHDLQAESGVEVARRSYDRDDDAKDLLLMAAREILHDVLESKAQVLAAKSFAAEDHQDHEHHTIEAYNEQDVAEGYHDFCGPSPQEFSPAVPSRRVWRQTSKLGMRTKTKPWHANPFRKHGSTCTIQLRGET